MTNSTRRGSLRHGLDRDVYQVVRKFEDERDDEGRITISAVWDYIQKSNSSLKRQKKAILEKSIERVLDLRKEENKAEEDTDEELEKAIAAATTPKSKSVDSIINRQLTKHWNFTSAASSSSVKRTATGDAMDIDSGSATATPAAATVERHRNGEPKLKRRRKEKDIDRKPPAGINLDDVAGLESAIQMLINPIALPLLWGKTFARMGHRPSSNVLLHGPSGCGKTMLATAFAANVGVAFISVSAPSLISGTSGDSEKNIRAKFDEAIRLAPCLLFIDELDAIAGKRDDAQKAMEVRMVSELSFGMDRIGRETEMGKNVIVLAATQRPDSIDISIRGRFSVEVEIGMPSAPAREQILRHMARNLTLADDVDFPALARLTPGYVGADLKHVISAAVDFSMRSLVDTRNSKLLEQRPDLCAAVTDPSERTILLAQESEDQEAGEECITFDHFEAAIKSVPPAAKREGFSAIPDTTWSHVGGMAEVRKKLEMNIIGPINDPERFSRVGIKPTAGILLSGPPGCGKTLVAKAVANESKANFISVKGPELLNKYVGESERAIRQLFTRAKSSVPCILFFDEMDALAPKRDDSHSDASSRVVNTLLTELDGVGDRSGIYVVGATNRPDCIDPAIRRPGRLGTSIYVGLPSAVERVDILKTIYRNTIQLAYQDEAMVKKLDEIALDKRCDRYSGADLENLMLVAAQASLQRGLDGEDTGDEITMADWEKALTEVKPSVRDDGFVGLE